MPGLQIQNQGQDGAGKTHSRLNKQTLQISSLIREHRQAVDRGALHPRHQQDWIHRVHVPEAAFPRQEYRRGD